MLPNNSMTEDFGGLFDQLSSDISYIDFLNSELNFKLSSYFEKPFKLNNSKKKHHWILRNLTKPIYAILFQ